jgi:hypothetical protein
MYAIPPHKNLSFKEQQDKKNSLRKFQSQDNLQKQQQLLRPTHSLCAVCVSLKILNISFRKRTFECALAQSGIHQQSDIEKEMRELVAARSRMVIIFIQGMSF